MTARTKCPAWVYKMREQTKNTDGTIMESEPFCDSGMMPASIVLRELRKDEFVSHMKIYPKDDNGKSMGKPHYAYGHYIRDKKEAIKDYMKRCQDYGVEV